MTVQPRPAAPAAVRVNDAPGRSARRRHVPDGAGTRPRPSAHARTAALRRDDAARARHQQPGTVRSADAVADFPQGPRAEGCRRRHARRELPQRAHRQIKADRFHLPMPAGSRFISPRNSASATASTAPSTTPTRRAQRFPDRRVFLTGEIIHNPHVNDKLRAMGIRFLSDAGRIDRGASAPTTSSSCRHSASPSQLLQQLDRARLHAGRHHLRLGAERVEERRATPRAATPRSFTERCGTRRRRPPHRRPSRTAAVPGGVRRRRRPSVVCDYIRDGGDRAAFLKRFGKAVSPGFDPERDLAAHRPRQPDDDADVGVAGDRRDAQAGDDGPLGRTALAAHYQAFDTICSATQDRQDAVVTLLRDRPVDLMIVIGGYNSSNTANLARICAAVAADVPHRRSRLPGLARRDPPPAGRLEGRGAPATGWLPPTGPVVDRPDLRRLHARQPRRRGHRQARSVLRLTRTVPSNP